MKKMLILALAIGFLPVVSAPESEAFMYPPGKLVKEIKVDLNNDGKLDNVTIDTAKETSKFTLTVNQTKITGFLGESEDAGDFEPDGFYIVNIDTSDNFKEIAVHSPGPSSDDEYLIYSYDGKSLKKIAKLSRWPTFLGNGIVLVDGWMGFWKRREKYVLNRHTRSLQIVPQAFYYVGVQAKIDKSFPIYSHRQGKSIVANLMPNSKINILVCDCSNEKREMNNWYLIKSTTGLVGWARLASFYEKVSDLPWAD
jgi:hypothetical protein